MPGPDPYGDIDFEEINEATGLAADEIKCLKVVKNIYYRKKNHFFNFYRYVLIYLTPRSKIFCLQMILERL